MSPPMPDLGLDNLETPLNQDLTSSLDQTWDTFFKQDDGFINRFLTSNHWIPRCCNWTEDRRRFGIQRWSSPPAETSLLCSPSSSLSPSSSSSSGASCWSVWRPASGAVAWADPLSAKALSLHLGCTCSITLGSPTLPELNKRSKRRSKKLIINLLLLTVDDPAEFAEHFLHLTLVNLAVPILKSVFFFFIF